MSVTTHLTHTFHTDQGDFTVPATSPVPGLFVYEIPAEVEPHNTYRWSVGHHSGLVVASAMYEDDAIRGAHRIAYLADWTKSVDELRASVDIDELYRRIAWAACEDPAYT
ncbi:hypothetical protein ACF1AL_14630 [Streptomyces sp. NPDC014801]|uniref:hypothetical protein n=1 Tax=Streptomyces sp. NPDC014801 TaxID=3364916 RepID=UPI0036F729C3